LVQVAVSLLVHGGDDRREAVPGVLTGDAACEVEENATVDVRHACAGGTIDDELRRRDPACDVTVALRIDPLGGALLRHGHLGIFRSRTREVKREAAAPNGSHGARRAAGRPVHKSAGSRTTRNHRFCHDLTVPKTVLIVDDHPSFRGSARAILEAEGFLVVGEAANGDSAIAATRSLHPDVVLLDVQLPDRSGFDVCAELLSLNGAAPEIVLVSSRDACDYGELIASSGARGFVPKAELSGEAVASLLE
jgi:CheY-like chemotaxis protein